MTRLLYMVAALAFAGPALAQNRTTEAQARSYIQSAFITGAAQGILAPDVAVGPRLRERLALPEQAGRDRVYGALFRLTEEKPLRVRKTQADEIGALVARAAGRPVFALEGGEVPLVMIYDLERNAIAYVGILGAAAVAGGTKGPALEATAVRVADVQPTARETQAPLIIRLKPILFAIDSATLAAQAKAALESDALPKLVDVHEMRYVVHGHADRLGPADYNRRLSARRAAAVRDYLVARGVPADHIQTVALGASSPQTSCSQKERAALIKCLASDRRVAVEIQPPAL